MKNFSRFLCLILWLFAAISADAQWTNRYPKLANVSHQVYLEGYNLPTLNQGASDPAVSPDGKTLAIAARGWIWLVTLNSREARRMTKSAGIDSRPAWSPDARQIAFVRDNTSDTSIVVLDVASGAEKVLIASPALDLDPCFSADGKSVFYSSAESGDLDLWQIELASKMKKRLTTDRGQELQPQPLPNGEQVLYLSKAGSLDSVTLLDLRDNSKRVLREEGIASQMRFALKPDGRSVVVNAPAQSHWQLWLHDIKGGVAVQIAREARYPLTPAWSRDGADIYFVEPDDNEIFSVFRIAAAGGTPQNVSPLSWNWNEPTTRVRIKTKRQGESTFLPARLTIVDGKGHPVLPDAGLARFDGQNGNVYFYSAGVATVEVPAGEIRVTATHGLHTVAANQARKVTAGETAEINLEISAPIWNARAENWLAADLHSHLNYGGSYLLEPEDIRLDMRAEALDLATPQLANLHNRFIDQEWWNWRGANGGEQSPMIHFAQEVRSHFLGHVAVVGADALYFPWYYGPGYPVYDQLDLPNSAALQFARARGGMNSYVHPVSGRDPFPANGAAPNGLPLELVPDAVLGDVDTIEVACLWSDELGTSEAWYRLLNLGIPITPSAGSDSMHNFYRTMPIGSTRVYAKPEGAMSLPNFLNAVKRGRSFVTNAPAIKFAANNREAGEIVNVSAGQTIEWKMEIASAVPVQTAEILINGKIVWSGKALDAAGQKTFTGKLIAPSGGWIAARVSGGAARLPMSDSYPFAHTAPVWFNRIGSKDAVAAKSSAQDLLRWMDVAEKRLNEGYAGTSAANLKKRFADARRLLEAQAQ